jgi:hypothetical protein
MSRLRIVSLESQRVEVLCMREGRRAEGPWPIIVTLCLWVTAIAPAYFGLHYVAFALVAAGVAVLLVALELMAPDPDPRGDRTS